MDASMLVIVAVVSGALFLGLLIARPAYALYLYVFTIPLEDWLIIGNLGTVSRIFGITFFCTYVLRNILTVNVRSLSARGWAWFGLAGLSWFWAFDRTEAGMALFTLLQLFAILFLITDLISRDPRQVNPIMWSYSLAAAFISVIGIMRFFAGQGNQIDSRVAAFDQQSVAHFAAALIPAFLFLLHKAVVGAQHRWERILALALHPLPLIAILVSGTRSAWIGLAVAIVFFYVSRLRRSGIAIILLSLAIAGVLVMKAPAMSDIIQRRMSTAVETGGSGRLDIWKVGFGIVLQHPVFGVGYGNFPQAFNYDIMMAVPFTINDWAVIAEGRAPHNIYLGMAAELGLVGLALLVYWLWPLLWKFHVNRNLIFMQSIILAYLVQGMFLDVLNRKYFWLPIAIAEGIIYAQHKARQVTARKAASRAVAGILVPQHHRHHVREFPQNSG